MTRVGIVYVGGEMMESKFMCLAPYQLAACLRERDIDVLVHELTPLDYTDTSHFDTLSGCDVVGFSCNSFTYAFVLPLLRRLKREAPRVVTVMGGVHTLHLAPKILHDEPVDYVMTGEADLTFALLVDRLGMGQDVSDLPGIAVRTSDGQIAQTANLREVMPKDLPIPAYDLLKAIPRILVFETSRGCPFRCTFCSIDLDSRWSPWTPDVVADRFERSIALLPAKGTLRNVMFADDNFATDTHRAAEILRRLNDRFPHVILSFETRAREILKNPAPFEVCVERGIPSSFLFGIECGYDAGLQRIRKKLTVEEVRRSAQLVHSMGLQRGAVFSYIVGFPWETRTERMATLRLAEDLFERYGVKSTVFYWLPIPSQMCDEADAHRDYSEPFWWRRVQSDMNRIVDDDEAALMAKVNANGNFSDTRIDETGRPDRDAKGDRSPRHPPPRNSRAGVPGA